MSFRELLGQKRVMKIRQGETLSHQGAITHKVCCSSAQLQIRALNPARLVATELAGIASQPNILVPLDM